MVNGFKFIDIQNDICPYISVISSSNNGKSLNKYVFK